MIITTADWWIEMDPVFEAHFPTIRDAFAEKRVTIEVANTPAEKYSVDPGQRDDYVDYVYEKGRLLALAHGDNIPKIERVLRGIVREGEPRAGGLVVLSLDRVEGNPSVPEALDIIDQNYPEEAAAANDGAPPLATPNHVVDLAKMCAPTEPEIPTGNAPQPWPEPRPARRCRWRLWPRRCRRYPVRILVVDDGLLPGADGHPWMRGVRGDPDMLEQRSDQPPLIRHFNGHGTFVAGVARCMAARSDIFVSNHLPSSGAELESNIVDVLDRSIKEWKPNIINLSAGSYNRNDWVSLSFEAIHQLHPDVTLIAAAGNDRTTRLFHPAAANWTISVGALAADEQHLAWFSNYGPRVDVYAIGEGIVNAYATGEYAYIVLPKLGAIQTFAGMARWSGTSFSTPLVAGLIADEMSRTGSTADTAAEAVLGRAQDLPGVGRVLRIS
jgi:subtilisin family serine protease